MPAVAPLRHALAMPRIDSSLADFPDDVVEPWWCPVCSAPAHRTRRPGRAKLYCSNACRQRAYRWRRDHHARTLATPTEPVESVFLPYDRWHARRSEGDFVSSYSDRRKRRPTVCGVLGKPSRQLPGRTHHLFILTSSSACRTCARLVRPPVDGRVTVETSPAIPPRDRAKRLGLRVRPPFYDVYLGHEPDISMLGPPNR